LAIAICFWLFAAGWGRLWLEDWLPKTLPSNQFPDWWCSGVGDICRKSPTPWQQLISMNPRELFWWVTIQL
jgi:hypothetical protein